jgi:hypothetical protein
MSRNDAVMLALSVNPAPHSQFDDFVRIDRETPICVFSPSLKILALMLCTFFKDLSTLTKPLTWLVGISHSGWP